MLRVHAPRFVRVGGRSVEPPEVAPLGNRVEWPGDSVDYSLACRVDQPSVVAAGWRSVEEPDQADPRTASEEDRSP